MESLIADTPAVTIRRVSVSSWDNNVYLLTSKRSGQQILIDAAAEAPTIQAMIADASRDGPSPCVVAVVTTHQHADHVQALAAMAAATGASTVAGREDAAPITRQTGVAIDHLVGDGDTVTTDGIELAVIGLRGHTPGSVALAYAEPGEPVHLFTGDSLFPGGVGNTDGDPARFTSLLNDVVTRLFAVYADDAIVHPGHGAPTTLGAERGHLDDWRARGW